jgi:hypothetical protein
MPRYMFARRSIVEEWFTVQAPDEQTALDMVSDGHPAVMVEQGEWIDWVDDKYHLEEVEDELITFTKGQAING